MADEQKPIIPPHVLAERNPARAFRLLLEIPEWREEFEKRLGFSPGEYEVDEERLAEWERYCDELITPEEMDKSEETFERIADDFILEQEYLSEGKSNE
jgi:hypothetical protein